ncbi:hypothetical protein L3X38_017616 [Prunus dulcis]|uniref:Uncharacterized protein n=1 Tax=Prunus dulcis TaxID=3755 RepID=A0AAD4W7F6_PRUDU|nr:hypothetical protein L3X38_017616 [Prunus dulcis]
MRFRFPTLIPVIDVAVNVNLGIGSCFRDFRSLKFSQDTHCRRWLVALRQRLVFDLVPCCPEHDNILVAFGMSSDTQLPSGMSSDCLWTTWLSLDEYNAYDIAPRVSGMPEPCGAKICIIRLSISP